MGWDGNYTDTCMHWGTYHIIMHNRLQLHSMHGRVHLLGEIDPSGASRSRLIIVGVADKSKLQITALILNLQLVTQLQNVVLDCLDPRSHGSSAIHQKTKINLEQLYEETCAGTALRGKYRIK